MLTIYLHLFALSVTISLCYSKASCDNRNSNNNNNKQWYEWSPSQLATSTSLLKLRSARTGRNNVTQTYVQYPVLRTQEWHKIWFLFIKKPLKLMYLLKNSCKAFDIPSTTSCNAPHLLVVTDGLHLPAENWDCTQAANWCKDKEQPGRSWPANPCRAMLWTQACHLVFWCLLTRLEISELRGNCCSWAAVSTNLGQNPTLSHNGLQKKPWQSHCYM